MSEELEYGLRLTGISGEIDRRWYEDERSRNMRYNAFRLNRAFTKVKKIERKKRKK